jgi:hypothetical protein
MTLRTMTLLATACCLAGCTSLQPTATPAKPYATHESGKPPVLAANAPTAPTAPHVGLPQIALSSASGAPGQTVQLTATMRSGSEKLAGTQNDISFDPRQVAFAAKANGKPDCTPNAALGKEGTAFSFLPAGCQKGGTCTSVRALVLSLSNVDPIADGALLYTCTLRIAADASPGAHALPIGRVGFSAPNGKAVNGTGANGSVTVR